VLTLRNALTQSLVFVLVFCSLLPLPSLASGGSFTVPEYKKLKAGTVLVKEMSAGKETSDSGGVQAKVLIKRPIEQVYNVMRDGETLFNGDPKIKKVRLVDSINDKTDLLEYTLKLSPLLPAFVYTNKVTYEPNKAFRFKRVKGSFKSMNGACELFSTGKADETLMVYTLALDLGMPLPPGLVHQFLAGDLPQSLKRIKNTVYLKYPNP
jgi:uncharacterized membrane protein